MRPGDDDDSPWARDDWTPEPATPTFPGPDAPVPTPVERAAIPSPSRESRAPSAAPPPASSPSGSSLSGSSLAGSSPSRTRRVLVVVVVVVVGAAIALLARTGSSNDPETAPTPLAGSSEPRPADTVGAVVAVTTTPATTAGSTNGSAVPAGAPTGPGIAAVPRPPVLVEGRGAPWAEWYVEVPEPLASSPVPTDLVVVSNDRILHRIEFPSGRVRSIDLADRGADASVEVGPDAIVVHVGTEMMVIRDDRPVEAVEVPDGIALVQSWPGTGGFVVITPALSDSTPAQAWVLDADSNLVRLDDGPFSATLRSSFRSTFLPSGELLVGRPGGVYALAPGAVPRRVSPGDLLGGGSTHYAVVECDEALRCAHWVVDAETGDRRAAPLDVVGTVGWDPSTRIAPGGRHVVFRDYFRGTGVRVVVDTTTGSALNVGRVASFFDADAWAADGSGLFLAEEGIRFLVASTGEAVSFDEFGSVVSLATRPAR